MDKGTIYGEIPVRVLSAPDCRTIQATDTHEYMHVSSIRWDPRMIVKRSSRLGHLDGRKFEL